ncbi:MULTISPECIES: membrane protein insertion efficiency factor YidD [Aphanizomenonaceae]|uniref:membrane protein insertion efficiency factor YidD n=1 Tax=Aphanizomenonaceae TaxID=1892259 RepID=UPI0004B9721D|nr:MULTISPECIES: membrane protein insertion efficiency factor YidD [Aphanizomenonaceae]MBE9258445.1 membrane protein insertion efficiency factor YidD [Dolichospermum sp. LEGE 00246]MDK2408820.1 membrane protein insertion efficiency factor YidD [Aphanizomenon sp. 202]MDK2459712.1 membrane protein insertion efficiency factor YidD [Aphanizomenon sp. PH219]
MQIFSKFIRSSLVTAINLYQRYLSPYKGYCCAHRVLHNGESCSEYVKGVFLEQDLKKAINLSQQRFTDCGIAAETLTGQKQQANLQRRSSHLLNRRGFIYLIIPAFFTFGVATPALASKGKAFGKCMSTATKASIRQDQKDGKCGNEPEIYYGLCCLGIIGLGVANEGK